MALFVVLVCLLATAVLPQATAQQESCAACNCPLDSDQDLDGYITSRINDVMGREPLIKVLQLGSSSSGRTFELRRVNMSILSGRSSDTQLISSLDISAGTNVISSDNILAYRPQFRDNHNSNLAAFFVNLEAVFPCLVGITGVNRYYPICRAFTNEEDGFRGGKSLLDTGDIGNGNFRIFSSTADISTYAMGIQGCPTWTTACFPPIHSFSIVCYLPRNVCRT